MQRKCMKCGHVNEASTGHELEGCPQCGAIYSRVEEAIASGQFRPAAQRTAETLAPATPVPDVTPHRKRADEKFCSECGAIINAKAEICPKCGVRQMTAPSTSPLGQTTANGKNKVVAGVLALFLGGIGVHKFYLGKGFQGILYLVFCWTFIPALFGLIEGLNYLLMSDSTFAQRYGA